jgi:hypothetical protein
MHPIVYVDDAYWYSSFKMKHESTRAKSPANRFQHVDLALLASDFSIQLLPTEALTITMAALPKRRWPLQSDINPTECCLDS